MFIHPKKSNFKKKFSALVSKLFGTITHVSTKKNIVALTFDDGPHPVTTLRLLEILKRHNAQATFFLLGVSAKRYPQIVKKIAQAGHAVCNHSWDHPSFSYISGRERRSQILKSQKVLAPYGIKFFRPPYGDQTFALNFDALITRHKIVGWNVSAKDWNSNQPNWYVEHLKARVTPGSIVLLHDTLYQSVGKYDDKNRKDLFEGLDMFLHQIGKAYKFVTVPELLKQGHPQRRLFSKSSDINWLNSLTKNDEPPYR
jgi:peptidoglycan-N-acetylglucosamine deacetylase